MHNEFEEELWLAVTCRTECMPVQQTRRKWNETCCSGWVVENSTCEPPGPEDKRFPPKLSADSGKLNTFGGFRSGHVRLPKVFSFPAICGLCVGSLWLLVGIPVSDCTAVILQAGYRPLFQSWLPTFSWNPIICDLEVLSLEKQDVHRLLNPETIQSANSWAASDAVT